MNRQGRIMIMDDAEHWREIPARTLRQAGFYVDAVGTVEAALQHLEDSLYHLLVLDVSMEAHDPGNIGGMLLLDKIQERGLNKSLKVIMLSAYPKEHMRAAFKKYQVLDFFPKDDFDNLVFLEYVQQIFSTEARINLKLDIHWKQGYRPEHSILDMELADTRLKSETPLHKRAVMELDDLLCRLFYEAESILVEPLAPGYSGTRVLRVRPFFPNFGSGYPVVVKFGRASQIEEEYNNFKRYAQSFVGGGRSTSVLDMRRTPYLGGISYSLLGFTNDQTEDFGNYYRRSTTQQIEKVIAELFQFTCSTWYANPGVLHPHNLTDDYQQLFGCHWNSLEQIHPHYLKYTRGKQKLSFKELNSTRTFTNPVKAAIGASITLPTYVCTTHGDFNQHNILIDREGHVWLIDFQSTGRGHILRDLATLDSVVRFQLLGPGDATLEERLQMEEALNSIERFSHAKQLSGKLATRNLELQKAYDTVVHLRIIAQKLVAQNPDDNINEYNAALLYTALNTLRFSSLQQRQNEHALLCASLLADCLGLAA